MQGLIIASVLKSDITHSVAVGLYCLRMQEATFMTDCWELLCTDVIKFSGTFERWMWSDFLYGNEMYENTESVSKIMQTNPD
jgi:hypothetical protein